MRRSPQTCFSRSGTARRASSAGSCGHGLARKQNVYLPLEDDTLITLDRLWEQMMEKERCAAIAQAMRALPDEDREIFYRFYDLSQTAAQIAEDLHLNASTVRSRLMRGRRTLREALEKGGLFCENDVG